MNNIMAIWSNKLNYNSDGASPNLLIMMPENGSVIRPPIARYVLRQTVWPAPIPISFSGFCKE